MTLATFPDTTPITLELRHELRAILARAPDGISEYTFADLYLFRERYNYRVSLASEDALVLQGVQPAENGHEAAPFFMTPVALPPDATLRRLMAGASFWKCVGETIVTREADHLAGLGVRFEEDRDNFDYLYLRTELADLCGKRFHKKRNLVNAFLRSYPVPEERPLTLDTVEDAMKILDKWREEKGEVGDYIASRESLENLEAFALHGVIFYIEGKPAGYTLGEPLLGGRMYAVHFEKALARYKGMYQYVNQAFCAGLPESIIYMNREQDLGDEGLRQAKMTYNPSGFVKKWTGLWTQ
jgi:hypothetical protein